MLDLGGAPWAIEVKLTPAPGPDDMARLDRAADLARAKRRILVSRTLRTEGTGDRVSCAHLARLASTP